MCNRNCSTGIKEKEGDYKVSWSRPCPPPVETFQPRVDWKSAPALMAPSLSHSTIRRDYLRKRACEPRASSGTACVSAVQSYLQLPRRNGVEGIPVSGWISEDAGMGAAIISRGDCVEFLLARGVPQHQSYVFAVHPAERHTVVKKTPQNHAPVSTRIILMAGRAKLLCLSVTLFRTLWRLWKLWKLF